MLTIFIAILIIVGIALVALGLFILVAVLGLKMKAEPEINQIELSPMSGMGEDFYSDLNQFLTSEGFEFIGDYSIASMSGKAIETRIYRNLNEGIEVTLCQQEDKNIRKMTLSFSTGFDDGSSIETTTNKEPPVFIYDNKKVYSLPIDDYNELLKFHRQKLKEELEKKMVAFDKMSAPVVESIVDSTKKELEKQMEYGLLKYDAANGTYSFTLYGAVRSIYKLIAFSFTKGKDKSMFDLQQRVENKKKERLKSINLFGLIFLVMGLGSFAKGTPNSAVLYFRIFSILIGGSVFLITEYILRTKKFEDSWK